MRHYEPNEVDLQAIKLVRAALTSDPRAARALAHCLNNALSPIVLEAACWAPRVFEIKEMVQRATELVRILTHLQPEED